MLYVRRPPAPGSFEHNVLVGKLAFFAAGCASTGVAVACWRSISVELPTV